MSTSKGADDMLKRANDGWQDPEVAAKYARMEAATRPYADIMVRKASLATNSNSPIYAFDLACGTGAVTASIYESVPKEQWSNLNVLGGDISPPMLNYLQSRGSEAGWPNLRTQVVDGKNIQLEKAQFTHVFANAIIFFLPTTTVKTLFELLQPGGFFGFSTWGSYAWYPAVEKAIKRLPNPPFLPPVEDVQGKLQQGNPWHEVSFIRKQLEEAGFQDVDVVQEEKKIACGTPAQYTESMAMPMSMIAAYWEEDKREETLKSVMGELRKVVTEEAGGEEEQVYLTMDGIVGVGWRPA